MKLTSGIFCILSILFLGALNCKSQPQISCDSGDTINLGNKAAIEYRYDFKVYNKGNQKLKITRVGTSCGCTTPMANQFEIEPGKSTDIPLVFDLKHSIGEKRVFALVNTNIHGDDSLKKFVFKMNVARDIESSPKRLPYHSGVKANSMLDYEISLKNTGKVTIDILKPYIDKDYFFESNVIDKKTINPNEELKIKFSMVIPEEGSSIIKLKIPTTSEYVPIIDYDIINDVK